MPNLRAMGRIRHLKKFFPQRGTACPFRSPRPNVGNIRASGEEFFESFPPGFDYRPDLSRPTPTPADRNRAAEAFALSVECAAAGDIAGEEAALRTAVDAVPDYPAANINYGTICTTAGVFRRRWPATTSQ
jgi:hypothetical protein